ncbi:hypothetical protein [Mycobacterium canetti]|uniref:hypothetical protein n=1 Tax=Mycobacterium canetti TaxID=78331 RepID=UPI000349478F|nr:hypothetical protein [Mycobacterium canetti]
MTTLATILVGADVITANTAPSTGTINRYNASGGALSVTLPALEGLNVGANFIIEKDTHDTTYNSITFTRNGGDTFDDGSTSVALTLPGEKLTIQVIAVNGTKYWKVTNASQPKSGLHAVPAQIALANSNTMTTIIATNLPAGKLAVGSTYRVKLMGTVQVKSTSGTLTFTPYLQGTALAATAQMASQVSAAGPVGFVLEFLITVRAVGASGSAIAKPWGTINFSTPLNLTSTSTSTTTVNTTAAAGSNEVAVKAQWATADVSNSLLVETATIERII